MVTASWELPSCFYSCFTTMGRNAQLALTKGKKSVQAFMGWVNSMGTDTHFIFLFNTWSDQRVSLFAAELTTLSGDCRVSLWLWLRHVISLHLSSFNCKMGMIIATLLPSGL